MAFSDLILIKVYYGDRIVRFGMNRNELRFDQLVLEIRRQHEIDDNIQFRMTYLDDEGDNVQLRRTENLLHAVTLPGVSSLLKIRLVPEQARER